MPYKTLSFLPALFPLLLFASCSKDADSTDMPGPKAGVSGKATTADGRPLANARIILEHTVWHNRSFSATADSKGEYSTTLPAEPDGSWTAKAQVERNAYGQTYRFDLHPSAADAFTRTQAVVRNFTWKLSGTRPSGGSYGAHIDLYAWGTEAPLDKIKLVLTPLDPVLVDGSPATALERSVEEVAGTFMAKDVPIGRYSVKAIYAGKTLLLKNRHAEGMAAPTQDVVFGKGGHLAETEYNIEFWVSE